MSQDQVLVQTSTGEELSTGEIIKNVSPTNYQMSNSPRPELTTMTNVVVLDLHTNNSDSPKNLDAKEVDCDDGALRTNSNNGCLVNEERVGASTVAGSAYEQLFAKIPFCDDQTLRLIGPNGESQPIISREILNGEHHILTRNENGDHIITRIVIPDHKMMNATENAIYTTNDPNLNQSSNEIDQQNGPSEIIYNNQSGPMPNHITTSVVQYTDSAASKANQQQQQHIYANATTSVASTVGANNVTIIASNAMPSHEMNVIENKEKGHIIYTHGDKTYVEAVDDSGKLPIYEANDEKQPIDLIYEEGGKTVIYTTSSDPKSMEIYAAGNQLGDGQMIVQGALQYTAQQINGQTVYVLTEPPLDADIVAQHQRRRTSSNPESPNDNTAPADSINHVPSQNSQTGFIQTRYFEHPLTAATSAMLNISGANNGGSNNDDESDTTMTTTANINIGALGTPHQVHQVHNPNGSTSFVYEYYKVPDKDGIQWTTPTTKITGQTTPLDVTGLSQNEIQALLLGSHPSTQNISVKREPEDLRKDPKCSRNQKVLVVHPPSPSLQIKEPPPSPGSPTSETMYTTTGGGTQIYMQGPPHQTSSTTTSGSNVNTNTPSPGPYVSDQYGMYATRLPAGGSTFIAEPYYREYFAGGDGGSQGYAPSRSIYGDTADGPSQSAYEGRYANHTKTAAVYTKTVTAAGLTVDLPSPDSGIGADAITPRDQNNIQQQSFDYTELCQPANIMDSSAIPVSVNTMQRINLHANSSSPTTSISSQPSTRSRPWHDFGRQNDADKIQIPKIYTNVGFRYNLESPISSSQRREDDRITYINKGQFYGITLEYVPDPDHPIKNQTVKSVIMLMFREEKSPEDEIKAWQFWHSRQHSVKQRILDADTKNSVGLAGCIEEVSHNAIAVYWNPLESSAKINIAVQCLSTDFSSQKGVKGLPLHVQIDTFEDPRDINVFHRGYCQIKVFCDKGAERKTRDEERRAAKRKMTATGRKKLDELYHPVTDRSEFYNMQDLAKPPVLFTPSEDADKLSGMDLQSFYGHEADALNGTSDKGASPYLIHAAQKPTTPTLKFHNHFPPDVPHPEKKDLIMEQSLEQNSINEFGQPIVKRSRMTPPLNERVMLYVRQSNEDVYTPLHVVPPTAIGLLNAIENKYKISTSSINNIYRTNKKGITAKIDDDMLSYYCNEDIFLLEVRQLEEDLFDITLTELSDDLNGK